MKEQRPTYPLPETQIRDPMVDSLWEAQAPLRVAIQEHLDGVEDANATGQMESEGLLRAKALNRQYHSKLTQMVGGLSTLA